MKRLHRPLTFWDRLVYGSIAGLFGALLGLGASLCLIFFLQGAPPFRWILFASAGFFFLVGVIRGPAAADLTGEAVTAVTGVALAEAGVAASPGADADSRWAQWSSPVLLACWIAMIGLLTWLL